MNQPELGKKILELRQNKGLTQGELAQNCNISLRTVQRIELAEVTPRSHTLRVILSSLDYDLDYGSKGLSTDLPRKEFQIKIWLEQLLEYLFELFNLKTNTMKKLSLLSLIMALIASGLFITKSDLKAQTIEGWFLTGSEPSSYNIGLDKSIYKTDGSSAFLESKESEISGFGTLMQTCSADEYLGKRIKMTAYIKSENLSDWSGMWMRVDSRQTKHSLSFDNMEDRPIKGTNDWTKCEIILDVPNESGKLSYGVLLIGTGKVWFDNIAFEIVDELTKPTKESYKNTKPTNLNFGE